MTQTTFHCHIGVGFDVRFLFTSCINLGIPIFLLDKYTHWVY